MASKRLLYHVTEQDHGPQMTVKRQTPSGPADGEPTVPRLCVCPTVPQCMSARLFVRQVQVYVTTRPTKGVQPAGVWDEQITDERWLLPGHRLDLAYVIDLQTVRDITHDILDWHIRTKSSSGPRVRIATLWRACVALMQQGLTPRWLMSWAERCVDRLQLDPLAMFD